MKRFVSTLALMAGLAAASAAFAQTPSGPDGKGNAPLKPAHTVNDGGPKRGANSFTQKQAMEHIEKSGFTAPSNLVKGDDGVWRGQAMRDGRSVDVAMDFKGNVSTPMASAGSAASTTTSKNTHAAAHATGATSMATHTDTGMTTSDSSAAPMAAGATKGTTSETRTTAHHRHHRRHHRHHGGRCANPSPNGAACSGVDRNHNGISDKEDRAINAGAHP